MSGTNGGGYNEMIWTQEEKTVECLRLGKGRAKTKGVMLKGRRNTTLTGSRVHRSNADVEGGG